MDENSEHENQVIPEQPEKKQGNLRPFLLIVLLVFVVVNAGIFYYFKLQWESSIPEEVEREIVELENRGVGSEFLNTYQNARSLLHSGSPLATVEFEKSIEQATTKRETSIARLNLGVSMLRNDPAQGISYLKEVSIDESLTNGTRANATVYVARNFIGTRDQKFATEHIFTGDVWQDFLSTVPENQLARERFEEAVVNALRYSTNLFSLPTAEYPIAFWHSLQAFMGYGDVEDHVKLAFEHVERGDAALTEAQEQGFISQSDLGFALTQKGLALATLQRTGEDVSPLEVISVYEEAISSLEIANGSVQASRISVYPRYLLSAFLVDVDPESYRDTILETLAPVSSTNDRGFVNFVRDSSNPDQQSRHRDLLIKLGEVDSEFRSFLLKHGFNPSDFTS